MNPRLSIRPATPQDVPSVLSLLGDVEDVRQVAPQEEPPLVEASIEAWIQRADRSFVMERDGRTLGFAALLKDKEHEGRWWMGHVVVAAEARGLGLGQSFVRALLKTAKTIEELQEIRLSVFRENRGARRAYYRCGFIEVARWREDGRTLVEMRWLNPQLQRGLTRPVVTSLGFIAATVSAMLLPWTARFWLLDYPAWGVALLLTLAGATTAICACVFYRVLPMKGAPLSHRLGRPVVYGALVGGSAATVSATFLLLCRWLGIITLASPARVFLPEVIEGGLRHGAAWGLILLLALDLAPHALGWRKRGG
jgi:RimJ/RimL family protein N-acetyltransferase